MLFVFCALLTTFIAAGTGATAASARTVDAPDNDEPPVNPLFLQPLKKNKNVDIYSLIVHSKIKYRYAQTVVSSHVANKGNISHEIQFLLTLPESAFISKFLIEINGKIYKSYVKEKEEAKKEYITAVNSGQTAALIEQNVRDSFIFKASVNVEAGSKVTFNLTYEQLLTRRLEIYEHVINVQPGQVVKNLQVIVDIEEPSNITTLEVLDIRTVNEIQPTTKNKLAHIFYESGNKVKITWCPTVKDQVLFAERGINGQFIVQYDVDHEDSLNKILIYGGYFVHFFAPTNLKPLRTHITFVLDVSASMTGLKLSQLKDAMGQILSEIHSEDFFSIIIFSEYAQVWTANATQEMSTQWDDESSIDKLKRFETSLEALAESFCVFPATSQNVQNAIKFIQDLKTDSSTNIEDAFVKAIYTAETGKMLFRNHTYVPKPLIMFLTDGDATDGITDPWNLTKYVSDFNIEKFPIFSLGFGDNVNSDFLKRLSLKNSGFSRVIYEASDAALQLRNFYKEISSPILSNISFKYVDSQVDNETITKTSFEYFFRGTELVVAGKIKNSESKFNTTLNANSSDGSFQDSTFFDIPIFPPITLIQKTRHIGYLEKLWAYLNIQQLMDKYELNKFESSNEKAKALELALKYSFVTPLTSLVVVKPNETVTTTNTGENLQTVDTFYQGHSLIGDLNLNRLYTDDDDFAPEPKHNAFSVDLNSMRSHNINELTWLEVVSNGTQPSITVHETESVYQVLMNTSGQAYQNCTTHDSAQGKCKHLKDCVVSSILNSIDAYLLLFCPVENIYAGICCADAWFE